MADVATTPDAILQLGLGFWGSKALLTAVELIRLATFDQLQNIFLCRFSSRRSAR